MAHNIHRHKVTGKDSFFSVKEKAWHGLGQIVTDYPTSAEAIQLAGLNYAVDKLPNIHRFKDGTEIISSNSFYTYRTDTLQILGDKIGADYKVIQNEQAFSFFDALVSDGTGIKYETAGALGNGERIFITAKLPECIKVGRKDLIEEYVFLTTSHDGSGSIMAAFTPVRIVCNNTLSMALKNHSNAVFIKHTANAEDKLKQAARIIAISSSTSEILETMFNKWAKLRITDVELSKLIRLAMSPDKEVFNAVATDSSSFEFSKHFVDVCGKVYEYAMTSDTQQMETTAGTVFGAYNAITGFYQNVKSYKTDDAKMDSIMFGTALQRSKKAFEICAAADTFLN